MLVIVDRQVADAIVARLSARDRRVGEDARAAVEWLTGSNDEVPAAFSRRDLQLFLWYQLPKKWLIRTAEQQAVAEALACFFDQVGAEAASLAALCRSAQTAEMIRTHGKNLAAVLERSGLEPPDTPLLAWSAFMAIEESLESDLLAAMLEDAIDVGELVPGAKGWRQRQTELVERYLANPDESGTAPIARIRAARRQNWLELPGRGPDERTLLEQALAAGDAELFAQTEAADAVEPLLWLLGEIAHELRLTQTRALPRALVRAAVERYPDWWDTATVGPPYQEAELYPLGVLHDLVDQLKLARQQHLTLKLTPKGRALRSDPQRLLHEVATMIAQDLPADFDLALAHLLVNDRPEIEWPVFALLAPFNGIAIRQRMPTDLTPAGHTLATAILNARAHGPRTKLG